MAIDVDTDAIRAALHAAPGRHAFGVVDAAAARDLAFEAGYVFGGEMRSLFLPDMRDALWDVAPYVVSVDPASGYMERWAKHWGASAGILLKTDVGIDELAAHLRSIFVVKDETDQEYFFRFYDPRVLRPFLPTCSPEQLREFFGPIDELLAEADEATLLKLSVDGAGKLNQAGIPVTRSAGNPA